MQTTILVAGATGALGQKICKALIQKNANVVALVRSSSKSEVVETLSKIGVVIHKVDEWKKDQLIDTCKDVSCVISALAGLRDVIVDAQLELLNAAVASGVPRFIPSDFCSDYNLVPEGENRNFDLRRTFQALIDKAPIAATSILNGCFAEVLGYNIPLFNRKAGTIDFYQGKKDWQIDFTTMDDTAVFTAMAALDKTTPRYLRIASFTASPADLLFLSRAKNSTQYELVDKGSMEKFSVDNRKFRSANAAGEFELYPKWQQAQYLYSMFYAHHSALDNDRYDNVSWSPIENNL